MASNMIEIMLFIANCLLIVENPKIIKGMFTATISIDKGILDTSAIIREIPITPQSMNIFGSKKLFNPTVADNTPNKMKKISWRR